MSTTHIVRIPGKFNLPSGWPRVNVADTLTGLLAHYVASDLKGLAHLAPVTRWASRTGIANLTKASPTAPHYRVTGDVKAVSFNQSQANWIHSNPILKPHAGASTFAAVFHYSQPGTVISNRQCIINTRGESPNYFLLSAHGNSGRVSLGTAAGDTIFADMPLSVAAVVVAVCDGANSSLSVNGVTVGGTVGMPTGELGAILLGSNSAGGQTHNGQIREVRAYTRALSTTEVQALTAELRAEHGI